MKLELSTFDDHNQPTVISFAEATATVADGCLIIIDARDNETLIGGFAPDMWSTFRIVED